MDESLEDIGHVIRILQVEPDADESTIKKQYKKLALHLHPDKNKFPGDESAFKLIGEAKRVLLDKTASKQLENDVNKEEDA
ncbi:unnamed protein product [Arabis nemorensis]|uniref:J domain-containing protein n=1 Tax=Arabis nemorensis TaxID=586526 RepID=A0A565CV53_9BRAS|nr:unnamed protein product [Arabis nemorensis]